MADIVTEGVGHLEEAAPGFQSLLRREKVAAVGPKYLIREGGPAAQSAYGRIQPSRRATSDCLVHGLLDQVRLGSVDSLLHLSVCDPSQSNLRASYSLYALSAILGTVSSIISSLSLEDFSAITQRKRTFPTFVCHHTMHFKRHTPLWFLLF